MVQKESERFQVRKDKGITLIALVVTIVVLVILSTVSIYAVLGKNGLIAKAQQASNVYGEGKAEEEEVLDTYAEYIGQYLPNNDNKDKPSEMEKGPNGKPLVTEISEVQSETMKVEDKNGNPITVPGGFKVRKDLGDTVQKGIVIEDGQGNQFVWIPVGSTSGTTENKVVLDNGNEVDIILGRYLFNTSTGGYNIKQKGSEYASSVTVTDEVGMGYQELKQGNGTNVVAKSLENFVSSVNRNHGYYIARYEASYGSGYEKISSTPYANAKPLSISSNAASTSSMDYQEETLWNFITQSNASAVSQNMYSGHPFVESDLINSYAWDTAIVYIQAMGNAKYALSNGSSKTAVLNTGKTGDVKCNIYDMAGNLKEWTTETGSSVSLWPCISRGGYYNNSSNTCHREYLENSAKPEISFRPIIYEIEK